MLPRAVSGTAVAALLLAAGATTMALPATPAQASSAPAGAAQPAAAAAAIAQAKETGRSVDIQALTTPNTTVKANPDGTLTLDQSLYPTRVKAADGTWMAVDTTLHASADGTVVPAATPSGIAFSGGGSGPLATLTSYGRQMAISWPSALPTPDLSGSTATYPDVLPDVDLAVTATPLGGFDEVLIVKTAAAADNPQLTELKLPTSAQGLELAADADGSLTASDSTGRVFFNAPSATMWDSSSPASVQTARTLRKTATAKDAPVAPDNPVPTTADGPGTGAQTADVPATISGGQISLTPDASLLRGDSTHYPVYIDPSWNPNVTSGARLAYDEVQEGCSSKNALNSTTSPYDTPGVGLNDFSGCTGRERAYYQFKVDTRLWNNTTTPVTIVSATMKAVEVYSASCSVTGNVRAYLTGAIDESTTWHNQPGDPAQSTLEDTTSFGPACTSNPSGGFDVSDAFGKASTGHWSVAAFMLAAGDESNDLAFKRFANNPTVTVTYDTTPRVTSMTTSPPTPCTGGVIGNTAITLHSAVNDPDKGSPVYANFALKNSAGAVIKSANQQGPVTGSGTLSWNIGSLVNGKYTWTAAATDLKYASAASTCSFTVDSTAPGAPAVTSAAYPNDGDADPRVGAGDFVFTHAADSSDTVRYAYNWGSRPPTVNPPNWVDAVNGNATKSLTPTGLHNILFVVAMDAAGNQSPATTYVFDLKPLTSEAPGDLTGDGVPDFITPGSEGSLHLYPGTTTGQLGGLFPLTKGIDFTNALLAVGDVNQDKFSPGVLARRNNGNLYFYPGNGDTEPLSMDESSPIALPEGASFTWADVTHITVASGTYGLVPGDIDGDGNGPDEFATTSDGTLWFIPATSIPANAGGPVQLATGWQGKTILAAGPYQGSEALWARNDATGELDLYRGGPAAGGGYIIPASVNSTKIVASTAGMSATTYPQLFAAPAAKADGAPGLWAQNTSTPAPKITFYPGTSSGTLGTPSAAQTLAVIGASAHADTIGTYRPGDQTFNLRNSNNGGDDFSFSYGASGDLPVHGDWNGDTVDTVGAFNSTTHVFTLRNSNSPGDATLTISYGSAGDIPVTGDWNHDGIDTIGVWRPSDHTFYLRNSNTTGSADISFVFGGTGDVPLTGDWNGDRTDTIGVYRPSNDTFYERNSNTAGGNDAQFIFGSPNDQPIVGDWSGHGTDTIGVWRPSELKFYLHNANASGVGDSSFPYGAPGDLPIAGDWSGR
ncbi:hypothetical protein [Actinacidiphila paucisporea]|uniref:hypothetical protein n=1 Tax=Actinacidiphila paucisporea TaxID=310782 RepID=UPI001160F808|nr:hypothetical protein [Actinacidiphila paucisporea]